MGIEPNAKGAVDGGADEEGRSMGCQESLSFFTADPTSFLNRRVDQVFSFICASAADPKLK